jgi:dipeptidyl aminopeptidase/acylaminoacyl peptidase
VTRNDPAAAAAGARALVLVTVRTVRVVAAMGAVAAVPAVPAPPIVVRAVLAALNVILPLMAAAQSAPPSQPAAPAQSASVSQPAALAQSAPPVRSAPPSQPMAASQPSLPITLDDLQRVVRLADLAWSPDGQQLVLTSTPDLGDAIRTGSDLWLLRPGQGLRRLTNDAQPDRGGSWNSSGTHLAFASRRGGDGSEQGWLWDSHDGALHPLAKVEGGLLTSPVWAADGSALAAIAVQRPTPTAPPGPAARPGRAGAAFGRVVLLAPGGQSVAPVKEAAPAVGLAWAPHGKVLALVARGPQPDTEQRSPLRVGIQLLDLSANPPAVRWMDAAGAGSLFQESPVWSPDGTQIAARVALDGGSSDGTSSSASPTTGDSHSGDPASNSPPCGACELRMWDVASGASRLVSLPLTDVFGPPVWLPDGKALVLPAREGMRVHLAQLRVADTLAVRWLTSSLEQAGDLQRPGAVAVAPDGKRLAYVRSTPRTPDEILLLDLPAGDGQRVTSFHVELLRKGLASVEAIELPPPAGPRAALLIYPPSAVAPKPPWPLVILTDDPHGPQPSARFDAVAQLAAGTGALVLRARWPVDTVRAAAAMREAVGELVDRNMANGKPPCLLGPPSVTEGLVRVWEGPSGAPSPSGPSTVAFAGSDDRSRAALERLVTALRGSAAR